MTKYLQLSKSKWSLKKNSLLIQKERFVILSERNLQTLDTNILKEYAADCEYLDLTGNNLSSGILNDWIYDFPHLKCIILDNNRLSERHLVLNRPLCHLKVLTLDKNTFNDLLQMANLLNTYFPNLVYLSLHGNPVCPNYGHEYENYKETLLKALPSLKFLDHAPLNTSTTLSEKNSTTLMSSWKDDVWMKVKKFLHLKNPQNKSSNKLYKAATSYHGNHSEGNRFITNSDL